jgi:hypothetical protein
MTRAITTTTTPSVSLGRSTAAIAAGFVAVAGLSLGTDEIFHVIHVYPPWGEPMLDPTLFVLALSYRIVYTVLGGFITARLASRSPSAHVMILGIIGLIAGSAGVAVALGRPELGPSWYPIGIAATAYPCTWLGGRLAFSQHRTGRL